MSLIEKTKNGLTKVRDNIYSIINGIGKMISNILIWAFLTAIAIFGVAYFVNVPIEYDANMMIEYRDFVVNKRSLKIHIEDCSSVSKMSERNKLFINNSLENLINSGYNICKRCKAGVKRKHENVARTLEDIENFLFGNEDISFKSYDEYLKSIDEMGEWYVNHIATYEGTPSEIDATENAKNYYRDNKNKIIKQGIINCYPCEYLKNCPGGYDMAGDDCVRFIFSCLNNMDNNFINQLSKMSKYKWSGISTKFLNEKENRLQYAFTCLGFEIYDIKSSKVDINHDNYFDFEIFPIDSDFELKKGDILSRDGHIHIYLGDDENFGWGKVNGVYPQKTKTYIDRENNNIICSGESFDRVYRYIGEN